MFNLQGGELIIILLLALVVLGPEKLPDAMRKAGQFYAELKKMSTGFQSEFRAAVEEPLRELRDTANIIRDSADFTQLQNGERDEKPKSAEMLAAADPAAIPTEDLPFGEEVADADPVNDPQVEQNAETVDGEPVEDVSPAVQEPFSSVIISNPAPRRAHPSLASQSAESDGATHEPKPRPQPFGSGSVSSAAPPHRPPFDDAPSESAGSDTESVSNVDDGPSADAGPGSATESGADAAEPTA